jgi:hypothetical protein
MSETETRLAAALHADAPPARDAGFRVDVLVRLERARFRRRVARAVVVAAVIGAVSALTAPAITAWMTADGERLWFVALAAATLCALSGWLRDPRFTAAARVVGRWLYP